MPTTEENKTIQIKNVTSFDLTQTLECGQCFRWQKTGEKTYCGTAYGKSLTVRQDNNVLTFCCSRQDFDDIWYNYFDLKTDYDRIGKEIAEISPLMKEIQQFSQGIRILQQDSWETLCSFILSQNNNIPRIKGIVQRLCENFGERIADGNYTFPSAETLCQYTVDDFAVLRSGFRARYIVDASQKVACGEIDLQKIRQMSVDTARAELMKIKGVGKKVADCTMLYGMGKTECFPVDVWIKKAMATLLPAVSPECFGENAGIAQQYIYYYSRFHADLFK